MHELGLMSGVVDTVVASARHAGADRVISVRLRIGDMTEVMDEALRFAWEVLRDEDPLTKDAGLEVDYVRPRSLCLACGNEFEHDRFHLRCPDCGSAETSLLSGRELDIVGIDIETPDDPEDDTPR